MFFSTPMRFFIDGQSTVRYAEKQACEGASGTSEKTGKDSGKAGRGGKNARDI
jgi:hypothetical protein